MSSSRSSSAPHLEEAPGHATAIGLGLPGTSGVGRRSTYILVFLLGVALVGAGIWYHVNRERQTARAHWKARLSALADDRARTVTAWLHARRADAELLADLPSVQSVLSGTPTDSQGATANPNLTARLDRMAHAYGYREILVATPDGRIVARSTGADEPGPHAIDAIRSVGRTARFRITPWEDEGAQQLLSFSAPVFRDDVKPASARPPMGVVMLRATPESGLFPILADRSATTRTGETLLFSYADPEPAYLSPLRAGAAGRAAEQRSLQALASRATMAAFGEDAFADLTDHREVAVFAVTRWIAPTGWGLVLKIDRDEAMEDLDHAVRLAGLAGGFLTLAFAGLLLGLRKHQQREQLLRAQIDQERAILSLRSYSEKIVASVPSGLLLLSGDLRILSANRSFLDSFYLRQKDVLGRPLHEVARAEGLLEHAREVLRTGAAQRDILFDLMLATRQETRPVRITMTGIQLADEDEGQLLLTIEDLTEEERLDAARRASEQRFRDLVQGIEAIFWEASADTLRFSFVSPRAEAILGHPVERWLSERDFWGSRMHPEDQERAIVTCRTAIAAGVDHEYEYRARAADGRELWLRDIVHVVRDERGRASQLRGLTVDITERKRAEEALRESEGQLRQAQKMEAVGQLAGGIAHDFNNLLMVIQSDSEVILRQLGTRHPLRRSAEGIREAAEQAATLTRQLLAFSRKQVLAPKVLDLNATVAGVHKILQRLIGEPIALVMAPGPHLGRVKADPGQIEQVIMNLAVNARDAMPDGGQLTVETANLDLDEISALHPGAPPGRYVTMVVRDTGCGMDAETQARLFEPFFTTKEPGKGTGLGLSTVYGIVKQSGGHIWVESAPGRGTTFRICLPRVEASAAPVEDPRAETRRAKSAGAQTILLVEDAVRVRDVVREILEMSDYAVLEASHGAEALVVSGRHQGPIHLMITDVVMPGMSGSELAQRLISLRPETKVLYMSGYTDDAIVRHGVLAADTPFLPKPFSPDALTRKVRDVLDGPSPRPVGTEPAEPELLGPAAPSDPAITAAPGRGRPRGLGSDARSPL
jgi:PAS domain S-box-containing protein